METTLREKNLTYFDRDMAGLAKMLREHKPVWSLVPEDEEGGLNLRLPDGHLLYRLGARQEAEKQLRVFEKSPTRIIFSRPERTKTYEMPPSEEGAFLTKRYDNRASDDHFGQYVAEMTQWLDSHNVPIYDKPTQIRPYYMVIWGIGLGLHLKPLLDKYSCESLVLIDETLDGMYYSLDYVDWAEIIESARAKNIKFKIFIEKTKVNILGKLGSTIQTESLLGLDGLMSFQHLQTPVLKVAFAEFQNPKTANLAAFVGFCADEFNMMKNSFRNLRTGGKRMLAAPKIKAKAPIIIVGSGPSLEKNIEFLKQVQDKAIIFSSGSSMKVLLRNGITPDLHGNLERAQSIYERHVELVDEGFDLKNIYAVMTTTIWPGVDAFFKDAVFFLRPALSPLAVFCEDDAQILYGEGPQVTNTAFAFSVRLQPEAIYLLGVDLGTTDPNIPRAKDAWQGIRPRKLDIPMRGNAGRTVMTDSALLQQKTTLEGMIRKLRGTIAAYNLGDGVKIEGAKAKRPSDVELPPLGLDKKAHVDELMGQFPVYSRERFLAAWDSAAVRDSVAHLVNAMDGLMSKHPDWDNKLIKAMEDINAYLNKPVRAQYAPRLLRGSVLRMLMHANSVIQRVDADRREEVVKGVKSVLSRQLRLLEFEAYSLADELESEDEAFQVKYE